MKKINYKETLEMVCRLYVFFFLFMYGFGKVIGAQFYTPGSIPDEVVNVPISQVSDFDLAWVFMGRSLGYMILIGIGEIIGAVMLLFNKTKLIGTFILSVIMINVIVFDIFFLDEYGALASAIIYFIMLLIILWINKEKVSSMIKTLTHFDSKPKTSPKEKIVKCLFILLIIAVIFTTNQLLVSWLGYGKG